jgi:hypothetical protein
MASFYCRPLYNMIDQDKKRQGAAMQNKIS